MIRVLPGRARVSLAALLLLGSLPVLSARALPQQAGRKLSAPSSAAVAGKAPPAPVRSSLRRSPASARKLTGTLREAAAAGTAGSGSIVHWGGNTNGQASLAGQLGDIVAVSAGRSHVLALRVDGTVTAAGRNDRGQCDVPPGLEGVIQVAASDSHSLALKSDGTMVTWGMGSRGSAEMPGGITGVTAITAGASHSLALKDDGTVLAWGDDIFGGTAVPAGLNNVIAVAAGAAFSLALKADGTVVAWGDNSAGQLNVPGGLAGVMAIDTGDFHCLALKTDGTVVGWGHNIAGQSSVPAGLTGVTDITAGSQFSMARRADGTVVAWGRNNDGQRNVPAGLGYVSAIAAGGNFALALRASSRLRAWGSSSYATAGPVLGAVQIAGGGTHSLVLRGDGELLGWGHGAQDQLASPAGIGPLRSVAAGRAYSLVLKSNGEPVLFGSYDPGISSFVPFGLPGDLTGLRAVAQGFNQALAVRANGTVAAWGRNTEGQCIVPDDLGGVKAVAGGRVHTLALRPDGTVAAWGQSDPIPAGLAGVTAIAVGEYHNLALKSDGTVVAWGRNTNGQCDVPADLTGVRAIAAGYYHSLALKDDGTIIGWGASSYGELTVPTGVTGVTQVAAGAFHSSAIFADPAPTLTAPSTLETVEDTPSAPLEFTLWDRETPLADLTVSASCSVPGLVQALTLTGSGATRTLGVSPSSDQFGTATVTLTVSDGISQTNHQIALTVHPRNDPPSYVKGEDQTVDEDAGSQSVPGWATHLSAGPSNEAGQQLLFNLVTNTRPELFISEPAVNPVTGDLTYTPAPNAHGNATIGFQLQDDGGTEHDGQDTEPDVQTFQITVNSVPDAPLARGEEYSLWKNTPLTVAAPGVLGNDVEYEGEALTAVLASGVSHGSLTLNPDGSFTYTPTAGYAGTDSFTYRARDTSGAHLPGSRHQRSEQQPHHGDPDGPERHYRPHAGGGQHRQPYRSAAGPRAGHHQRWPERRDLGPAHRQQQQRAAARPGHRPRGIDRRHPHLQSGAGLRGGARRQGRRLPLRPRGAAGGGCQRQRARRGPGGRQPGGEEAPARSYLQEPAPPRALPQAGERHPWPHPGQVDGQRQARPHRLTGGRSRAAAGPRGLHEAPKEHCARPGGRAGWSDGGA
ncbi:MAG: hypothetical protein K0Q72_1490, partial [Armatimonadetes bacterium]|nr:hypothetical protein [Armatimonadota bacterium]